MGLSTLGVAWILGSAAIVIVSQYYLYVWLVRRGGKVEFMWTGAPWHLPSAYSQWCAENGRRRRGWRFWLVPVAQLNLYASVISTLFRR
jgi:hypothetical protein